jgi:hypothetical protein
VEVIPSHAIKVQAILFGVKISTWAAAALYSGLSVGVEAGKYDTPPQNCDAEIHICIYVMLQYDTPYIIKKDIGVKGVYISRKGEEYGKDVERGARNDGIKLCCDGNVTDLIMGKFQKAILKL